MLASAQWSDNIYIGVGGGAGSKKSQTASFLRQDAFRVYLSYSGAFSARGTCLMAGSSSVSLLGARHRDFDPTPRELVQPSQFEVVERLTETVAGTACVQAHDRGTPTGEFEAVGESLNDTQGPVAPFRARQGDHGTVVS